MSLQHDIPWLAIGILIVMAARSKEATATASHVRQRRPGPPEPKRRPAPPTPQPAPQPAPQRETRLIPLKGAKLPTTGIRSFHYQRSPTHKHHGVDLPARQGMPVYAARAGTVTHASNDWERGFSGFGRHVVIEHGNGGSYSLYAHLDKALVQPGQTVTAGQQIGTVGRTKFSSENNLNSFDSRGAHLHFEVSPVRYPLKKEAPRMDPVKWLRQ